MNTRDYKTFRSNNVYHIYNRGDNKEPVFFDDGDLRQFIKRLAISLGKQPNTELGKRNGIKLQGLPQNAFSLYSYCLMPNHFHFEIRQNSDVPIGSLIHRLCTSYTRYINKKYGRIGNLFQDTFKAIRVDQDEYLIGLSAYIHCNPAEPFNYPYSSLSEYLGESENKLCDTSVILNHFNNDMLKYKDFIKKYQTEADPKINHLLFNEDEDGD